MREVESGIKEEEVGLDERNNIYEGRIEERKRVKSRVTACGAFFFCCGFLKAADNTRHDT